MRMFKLIWTPCYDVLLLLECNRTSVRNITVAGDGLTFCVLGHPCGLGLGSRAPRSRPIPANTLYIVFLALRRVPLKTIR